MDTSSSPTGTYGTLGTAGARNEAERLAKIANSRLNAGFYALGWNLQKEQGMTAAPVNNTAPSPGANEPRSPSGGNTGTPDDSGATALSAQWLPFIGGVPSSVHSAVKFGFPVAALFAFEGGHQTLGLLLAGYATLTWFNVGAMTPVAQSTAAQQASLPPSSRRPNRQS